jgi:hypothetical protein
MRAKALIPVLAAALLGLAACDFEFGNFDRFTRDFHYSYPMNPDGRLTVESFNGSVEISGWDQNTVDISGTKYGPTQEAADDLKISIDNSPAAVSIRAVRPSDFHGNFGARFVIKVPRTALLDRITSTNGAIRTVDGTGPARLKTTNGAIRVEALRGNVDAQTTNGGVEFIETAGDVTAHTTNGRIRAEGLKGSLDASTSNAGVTADLDRVDRPVRIGTSNGGVDLTLPATYASDIRVNTTNGGITLHLPAQVNAHVMARTTNSSVTSDFEVRQQGEFDKHRLDGTIGTGGPLIDLTTSNGGIHLLRM